MIGVDFLDLYSLLEIKSKNIFPAFTFGIFKTLELGNLTNTMLNA